MKRIKFFAISALCCLALVACHKSVDSKIDDYEKALKKGDVDKALKIADELEEEDLTFSQKTRLLKISFENADVFYKTALEESGEDLQDALEETSDELQKAFQEAAKEFDEASQELNEELEEAKEDLDDIDL